MYTQTEFDWEVCLIIPKGDDADNQHNSQNPETRLPWRDCKIPPDRILRTFKGQTEQEADHDATKDGKAACAGNWRCMERSLAGMVQKSQLGGR